MIYLAIEETYEGVSICGASYSEEGAKRIIEDREWPTYYNDPPEWRAIPDRWVGDPQMQEYCRQHGRIIWRTDGGDCAVILIEEVEE